MASFDEEEEKKKILFAVETLRLFKTDEFITEHLTREWRPQTILMSYV